MTQEAKFIPIKMNWQGALPMFVAVLQSGNAEGRDLAKKELNKLAKMVDNDYMIMFEALVMLAGRKSAEGEQLSLACMGNIAKNALNKIKGAA